MKELETGRTGGRPDEYEDLNDDLLKLDSI